MWLGHFFPARWKVKMAKLIMAGATVLHGNEGLFLAVKFNMCHLFLDHLRAEFLNYNFLERS